MVSIDIKQVIKNNWVKINSSNIDVPIYSIAKLRESSTFYLQKNNVANRKKDLDMIPTKLFKVPTNVLDKEMWKLNSGVYNFLSNIFFLLSEGFIGYILFRDELNRNGLIAKSEIYREGFTGFIGGTLYVLGGNTYIEPGSIIGKFIITKSENEKMS